MKFLNLKLVSLILLVVACSKEAEEGINPGNTAKKPTTAVDGGQTGSTAAGNTKGTGNTVQKSSSVGTIIIRIANLNNSNGNLCFSLHDSASAFPEKSDQAFKKDCYKIDANPFEFQLDNIPPGTYAFAFHHDDDANNQMKKNFLGVPQEQYGFSNGAKATVSGAPSFSQASFSVAAGQTVSQTVNLQIGIP